MKISVDRLTLDPSPASLATPGDERYRQSSCRHRHVTGRPITDSDEGHQRHDQKDCANKQAGEQQNPQSFVGRLICHRYWKEDPQTNTKKSSCFSCI
jgi:hypothetical protein